MKNNFESDRSILKSLLVIAVPILIGNLLQSAYQLTDAFWLGRVGENAVSAVSISFPITFFMISLGSGFAMAGSTLIAQYFGAKNKKMVNHVGEQTTFLVAFLSVLIGTIGFFSSKYILGLLNVEQDIFNDALYFLRISFVGLIFVFFFAMFQAILRGIGEVKFPMKVVFMTVMINFIVDPLFIFGYGFVPGFGVGGAAIATLITQSIASFIGIYVLIKGKYGIKINISEYRPDFKLIKRIFKLGLPSSLEMSARSLGLVAMTFLITSFGSLAIAFYGAGSNVFQFIMILSMGISMATAVLVGQNIGAGNIKRAEKISLISMGISFLFLTLLGTIVFLFAPLFVKFFVPDSQSIINGGANYLRTISFSFGLIGIQMVVTGVLRAAGRMKTALVTALMSQWVFQFPIAFVLSKYTSLGLDGIWYAILITNVFMAMIVFGIFKYGSWKKGRLTKDEELQEKVFEDVVIEEGLRN